jgi:hypothetical protein
MNNFQLLQSNVLNKALFNDYIYQSQLNVRKSYTNSHMTTGKGYRMYASIQNGQAAVCSRSGCFK